MTPEHRDVLARRHQSSTARKAVTVPIERRTSRQPMPLASVTRFKAPKERAPRWVWIGVAVAVVAVLGTAAFLFR
jgi:anti-sigma-K factor RskA